MKFKRLLFALIVMILLNQLTNISSTQAELPTLGIEITPTSIELPPQVPTQVVVIVRNPSSDMFQNVRLSWYTDANVKIVNEVPPLKTLVPNGEFAWPLQVSQIGEGLISGSVHLRIDYTWQRGKEGNAVPRVTIASFKVRSQETEAVEKVAEIQVKTTLVSLNEQHPGKVHLVVRNKTSMSIRMKKVLPIGPEGIAFESNDTEAELAPHEIHTVHIDIKAKGKVRPGKHLLLFEVPIEWEKSGRKQMGKLFETQIAEVGILGVSEILSVFGIPSFLILPGFLIIVTAGLLWKISRPRGKTDKFLLEARTPEFWLVAITLSIIMALLYPVVTHSNYLEGYELRDVVRVWMASILLGVLLYIGVTGGINLIKWYSRWKIRRSTPSSKDTPITILHKLHRQGLGVILDRVDLKIGEELQRAYLLEPHEQSRENIWVAPNIVVRLMGADPEFQKKVEEQLGPKGSAVALAALLKEGNRSGVLRVMWKKMGQLKGPYEARKSDIKEGHDANVVVEVE